MFWKFAVNIKFFLFCVIGITLYHLTLWSLRYLDFHSILSYGSTAPCFDVSKEAVYNQCKSFSQRSRLLGPLRRNTSNGELFFPHENTSLQDVYLLLRYSPRREDEGGLYLQLATSYLLSKNLQRLSIQQQTRTRAAVFLSANYTTNMYERLKRWFNSIYAPYTKTTHVIHTKAGNQASWEYMMNYTKYNKEVQPDTILFLLEDDYIYEATMLSDTIEFFASHNPCFVHQTDYPDRYHWDINDDDGHITVVAGKTRLWRSIPSTTVTYACRFRTFLAFEDIIMHPNSDWKASHNVRIRAGNAVFFSAIPSHGAHTETLLLHNEENVDNKIRTAAYYKDWWLLGRHALFEAQKKKTFPAPKMNEQNLFYK
jgi:hypothetical protein